MLVLVPLFAAMLYAVYRNRRLVYGEHLVFALHLHTFWLLAVLAMSIMPDAVSAWIGPPVLLAVPAYALLGWVAVVYLPALTEAGGLAMVTLIAAGGILYTIGGIVYGTKRPDPYPAWFGFHEVFHALTLLGFLLQYVAVSLVLYGAR